MPDQIFPREVRNPEFLHDLQKLATESDLSSRPSEAFCCSVGNACLLQTLLLYTGTEAQKGRAWPGPWIPSKVGLTPEALVPPPHPQ
jgi:hypothetical protein